MKKEIWKPVLGWEKSHEVSNLGRVRSFRRGQILRPADTGNGYLMVLLWINARKPGERKRSAKVHRVVLESFTGTKNTGMHVAHIDGDKQNNHLTNLKWATIEENQADKRTHGKMQCRKGEARDKLTKADVKEIKRLLAEGWSSRALGTHFKVDPTNIDHIRKGRTWKSVKSPAFMGESK